MRDWSLRTTAWWLTDILYVESSEPGYLFFFFFQAEDGIRDLIVTGVQTCALPISPLARRWTAPPHISVTLSILARSDGWRRKDHGPSNRDPQCDLGGVRLLLLRAVPALLGIDRKSVV